MQKTKLFLLCACLTGALVACTQYHSPARAMWPKYLTGASFTSMTETARIAKRPVYLGAGGTLINTTPDSSTEYGDKNANDNVVIQNYMMGLENALYDSLRKPGISVQRAGTDVVVILVRDAIMELNVPDISQTGADTLDTIAKILRRYKSTYIEIAGYTDATRNANAARSLSMDMAERVGVYFAEHRIMPERMFIVGRGSARPIAAQDDIGRLTNRRVEILIAPAR